MDSSVYTDKRSEVRKQPLSEVFNEDCMLGMARYPDKYFDLAIVDPQTGQDEGKKHASRGNSVKQKNGSVLRVASNHQIKEWDSEQPPQEYFDELIRVCRHVIIMCEPNLRFKQKDDSAGRIVWNLLRDTDFSVCQIMWTNLFQRVDYFEYLWNGFIQGVSCNSRLQIGNKQLNEQRIHPSQKPVTVYKWLLHNYAQLGFKILDTHLGSGSSRIAAYDMGFDFTAFEIDKDYFHAQEERFQKHIKQLNLFAPVPQSNKGTQLTL
jgi:site-specific DNA-methyltransferase (adenine-specific)